MRWSCFTLLFLPVLSSAQSWVQLPDFPGTARNASASFHWFDKVFVGTGLDEDLELTNDWYAYSMILNSWEPVAPLPATGRQHCNGFRLGDVRGYLFGGIDANGALNELWRYDPLTDTWTQRTSLPGPGRYACAVITSGDEVFVCGGMLDGGIPTSEVWRYDLVSDTWEPRTPMPGTPRHHAVEVASVIVGGADSSFQALSDAYAYNPISDQWSVRPDLPFPRYDAAAVEHLFFCGASSTTLNHDEVLVQEWSSGTYDGSIIPPFPGGPRKGGVAATQSYLFDVGIFFFGLGMNGSTRYNDWWRLDYGTGIAEQLNGDVTIVYPNPGRSLIHVQCPAHWTDVHYQLLDAAGSLLRSGSLRRDSPLDVQDLAPGRYELILQHGPERRRISYIQLP